MTASTDKSNSFFNKRSLLVKLMTINIFVLIPILGLFLFFVVPQFESRFFQGKKDSTKTAVESVFNIFTVYEKKITAGEISIDVAKKQALEAVKALRYNESDYFWINDEEPRMIMHPMKAELDGKPLGEMADPNGKKLFIEMVRVSKESGSGFVDYFWPKPGADKPVPKISFVKLYKPWGWIIGSGVYVDDVVAQLFTIKLKIYLAYIIATFFGMFIAFIAGRVLTKQLSSISRNLGESGFYVGSSSSQLSGASQMVSKGSIEAASSLEEIVSSVEELSSMVKLNSNSAKEAAVISSKASQAAEAGQSEMDKLSFFMNEIVSSSKKIENIIAVIDDIAFQTNLLALNASVEAARAGEQGRGFAVVADSVRTLAQRSAVAAKDITGLIYESSEKIMVGRIIAEEGKKVLQQIVISSQQVAKLNSQISEASAEQSNGLIQIGQAMSSLDSSTQQNASASEQMSASAEELLSQSTNLQNLVFGLEDIVRGKKIKSDQNLNNEKGLQKAS
jgi:methyl-accepting chemotaxis protein